MSSGVPFLESEPDVEKTGGNATNGGFCMSVNLSIAEMLAQLEKKVAHHREQRTLHAKQEAFHREQKEQHDAELQMAVERFEAFQAASAAAGELLGRAKAAAAPPDWQELDLDLSKRKARSWMISQVLATKAPDEPFGPSTVTREIHNRWGARLRGRVDPRTISATLRRWAAAGRIHCVREGKAHYESLYVKQRP
jgi:hypothetical protein